MRPMPLQISQSTQYRWFVKPIRAHRRLTLLTMAMAVLVGHAQGQASAPRWVVSWAVAPCAPAPAEPRYDELALHNETVRQVVHLSIGGLAIRVRFSNAFGTEPLTLQSATAAPALAGGAIAPGSAVPVTVGGQDKFTIAPGKWVLSDTVNVPVAAQSDLAISFFVVGPVNASTIHYTALQTSYLGKGDQAAAATLNDSKKISLSMIAVGVDVASRTSPYAIVAIGSSTTDGAHSTANANRRWTNDLFRRLAVAYGDKAPAVVNEGISGNRVLHDGRGDWGPVWGESAVRRFNRDVLAQSGAGYVIAFEGGNDIRQPGSGAVPLEEGVTAQQLIAGFQLMAKAAHDHSLKIVVGTITPFEHADLHREENPVWEQTRLAFNNWVRHAKEIDGVADFDAAIRDPAHPARILARFDSGDHLHPNDDGYQAMADCIDLKLFGPATQN